MIPKIYLDLDVLSYAAGLPEEDGKFEVAKKVVGLARKEAIKLVISWTAIRTSLRLSEIPREAQQFYEEVFRKSLEYIPHETFEPKPNDVEKLAHEYYQEAIRKFENAFHVAVASLAGADYLLSWDEEHLVKRNVTRKVSKINLRRGLKELKIMKPENFIPY